MAILYKALTELYRETQRKVTAPSEWQAGKPGRKRHRRF